MENLTRIYFDYLTESYSTENKEVGNNSGLNFEQAVTIQRQELTELVEEGLLTWEQAFKMEGDFYVWDGMLDAWEEVDE